VTGEDWHFQDDRDPWSRLDDGWLFMLARLAVLVKRSHRRCSFRELFTAGIGKPLANGKSGGLLGALDSYAGGRDGFADYAADHRILGLGSAAACH